MGVVDWLTKPRIEAIEVLSLPRIDTEAVQPGGAEGPVFIARKGFETSVPQGGIDNSVKRAGRDRSQKMQTLRDVYKTCPWVSIPTNVIARTATAGGVVILPDADTPEGKQPTPPPAVQRLSRLVKTVNPREDMRQLILSTIIDLVVFGDGWIEVGWLAGEPVALWTLDATTMDEVCDEHGNVTGYTQTLPDRREPVKFALGEVIHISLTDIEGGVYGQSPTELMLVEIDTWLFAAGCLKEMARKGFPPRLHVDLPASNTEKDQDNWVNKFKTRVLKALNIGTPVVTRGGGKVTELAMVSPKDVMDVKDASRDTIIAGYGVPPRECGIKTPGQLGGTGEAEGDAKRLKYRTVGPITGLVLEKLNYVITLGGFGIRGWHVDMPEVDWQSSEVAEKIRDQRLRNGAWTLNRYRQDIGEPAAEGGDDPVIIDRGNIVFWSDIARYTAAEIAKLEATPTAPTPDATAQEPPVPPTDDDDTDQGDDEPPPGKPGKAGKNRESEADRRMRALTESYRIARRRALRELPPVEAA